MEELQVDTGGLEVALVATVVQLAGAVAGLLRLSGAWFVMGVLLSLHVVVWMGLGVLAFFSGVLPSEGGWFPVEQWDFGLLLALVAATIVLAICTATHSDRPWACAMQVHRASSALRLHRRAIHWPVHQRQKSLLRDGYSIGLRLIHRRTRASARRVA